LRLYPRQNQHASLHFLAEIRAHLPFPVRKLHCDNGLPQKSRERHETQLLRSDGEVSTSLHASPSGFHRGGITRRPSSQKVRRLAPAFTGLNTALHSRRKIRALSDASTAQGEGILPAGLVASGSGDSRCRW
jgi:hypothetical protein